MNDTVVHVDHLSKHFRILNRREGLGGAIRDLFSADYKTVRAVDDISFDIQAGEIVGYIGPNGAGKSTTIKMMTGVLKPSDGTLLVSGNEPYANRRRNAQTMGVVFGQRTQLWWDLPVIESFRILKEIYRVDDATYEKHLGMFNELVDLKALYSQPVRKLSLGQRMLCDITASFLHNPRIVFLDEPSIGLDVSVKSKIRSVIRELNRAQRTTIILTTHDLGDVEALCRRIIIIDKGKIIYDGPIGKVTALFGAYRTLKVQIHNYKEGTSDQLEAALGARFGGDAAIAVEHTETGWTDVTVNQDQVPLFDVLRFVMETLPIKDVRIVEISMENVVQQIYDGALK
ncbi:MAG: ATP-binding cassette domain-containing protein [Anaerolineae bacterium]|nr:ATP-binding cassette domain-containing protein [Anaerolineae bacterium]